MLALIQVTTKYYDFGKGIMPMKKKSLSQYNYRYRAQTKPFKVKTS